MQEFTGIGEKLKRAQENIFNLDREITGFFEEGDYPVLPKDNRELFLEAIEYHNKRVVPPRLLKMHACLSIRRNPCAGAFSLKALR